MNNGAKSLIIAPTGSGKTYSVDAIFKQITAESEEEQILCLLCPNRVQNIQNEKSDVYSFEALIEGVCLEDNGQNIRQISAVYDKIPEIRKYKKEHPDCRLRVVIDECHNLISANIFREQAIQAIMRLIRSNVADSYTFITATYDNMCCFAFDNIVLFEDKSYKPVFGSIDIRFTEKKYFENLVMDTALKERKAYIRLNHKDSIKRIEKALLDKGQRCFSVTSGDKGYTKNSDGRKKGKGKAIKNITLSKGAMESLRNEFNEKMSATISSYSPLTKTPFKNLVYSVYIVINQNSKSREPELTEPILKVDDVPFK